MINATLNHDALWQTDFPNLQGAMDALRQQLFHLAQQANFNRPQDEWDGLFRRKVARPILFVGQSLVRIPTPAGLQTATPLKMFLPYAAGGAEDLTALDLAGTLNGYMQTILKGIPGRYGVPPQ